MATYCEHHIMDVDDESFLLDNENISFGEECKKCKQKHFLWPNCDATTNSVKGNVCSHDKLTQAYDENCESPEDSPLLIEVLSLLIGARLVKNNRNFLGLLQS